MYKVDVEGNVEDQKTHLLTAVPDVIEVDPALADLHPRGDPDDRHARGEDKDDNEDDQLQPARVRGIEQQKRHTVDEDLRQAVHFDSPYARDGEKEPEARVHSAGAVADAPPDDGVQDGGGPVHPDHDEVGRELLESMPSRSRLADRLGKGEACHGQEESQHDVGEHYLLR